MIKVHRKATMPILPSYNLTVYNNTNSGAIYIPTNDLLNAGVPSSALEDKQHKGFGKARVKNVVTVNYFGQKINCVTIKEFIKLMSLSETPLGKAVLGEMVSTGIKESSKHIKPGEFGKITAEDQDINVRKDSRGVSYFDISGLGATEEDLIELRKDAEFWKDELLKLEYIDLPEQPEFGGHPLTEQSKHPDTGDVLVNFYGFASIVTFGLFQHNTTEGKEMLRKALEHAKRGEEYYFFLYSIKRGVDVGSVTMAQGLIAEYLEFEFKQQHN